MKNENKWVSEDNHREDSKFTRDSSYSKMREIQKIFNKGEWKLLQNFLGERRRSRNEMH